MSTRKTQLPVSGFPFGLNAEASVINVLPSEMMDGSINVELLQNGSLRRRRGIDTLGIGATSGDGLHKLVDGQFLSLYPDTHVITSFYTKLPAPNGTTVERIIVAVNDEFRIFTLDQDVMKEFNTPYQTITFGNLSYSDQAYYAVSFDQSSEKVYFTGRHLHPGFIQVDSDNDTLLAVHYDVRIRDRNLGKGSRVKNTVSSVVRLYDCVQDHTSSSVNEPGNGSGDWEDFWVEVYEDIPTFINSWATSTGYVTSIVTLHDVDTTATAAIHYPTSAGFFAGRPWLAGSDLRPNEVLFNQVVFRDEVIGRFYQSADPLETNDPAVVDSDGGNLFLQGSGFVKQLLAAVDSMFIGTTNGIFQIKGAGTSPFKATDFVNVKVLKDRVAGQQQMVALDQEIMIFGEDSIWLSQIETSLASGTFGTAEFIDLLDGRLSTFYAEIPQINKAASFATYNGTDKTVRWFFTRYKNTFQTVRNTKRQPVYATHVLSFDTRFFEEDPTKVGGQADRQLTARGIVRTVKGAFYLYEYQDNGLTDGIWISHAFVMPRLGPENCPIIDEAGNFVINEALQDVVATGDKFEVYDTMLIVQNRLESEGGVSKLTLSASFGVLHGCNLRDWSIEGESDGPDRSNSFTSKIVFGVQTGGDLLHKKGGAYLTLLFKKLPGGFERAGAFVRQALNFSTGTNSPKYGPQQRAYYPDRFGKTITSGSNADHDHTWFKMRIRGRGNAQQFVVENDGDKDFHLIGYNYQYWQENK